MELTDKKIAWIAAEAVRNVYTPEFIHFFVKNKHFGNKEIELAMWASWAECEERLEQQMFIEFKKTKRGRELLQSILKDGLDGSPAVRQQIEEYLK